MRSCKAELEATEAEAGARATAAESRARVANSRTVELEAAVRDAEVTVGDLDEEMERLRAERDSRQAEQGPSTDRLRAAAAAHDRLTDDLALARRRLAAKVQEMQAVADLLDQAGVDTSPSLPERVKALVARQESAATSLSDIWNLLRRENIRLSGLAAGRDIAERRLARALAVIEELRARFVEGSRSRAARAALRLRRLVGRGVPDDRMDLSRLDEAIAALGRLNHADLSILAQRGVLDAAYYLETNPDLIEAGVDPVAHYFAEGAAEMRRPHADFDAAWYLARNPDVAEGGLGPLAHYVLYGAAEGRSHLPQGGVEQRATIAVLRVSGLFDEGYYRARYSDAVAPGDDALTHFVETGVYAGYNPSARFSTTAYLEDNPDIAAAGTNPLLHYALHGRAEGRTVRAPGEIAADDAGDTLDARLIAASGLFDPDWYAMRYADVPPDAAAAWRHFLDHGRIEGRRPNEGFDPVWYADRHPDVGGPSEALLHYIRHGASEGRKASEDFDAAWYAETYPDVPGGAAAALAHYVRHGRNEGRLPRGPEAEEQRPAGMSELFDPLWYLGHYADVPREPEAAWRHFIHHGWKEKRKPNAYFDPHWYEQHYPDIREAGFDPLSHFILFGAEEGRAPSAVFDTAYYQAMNPDVISSGENPLAHYLREGKAQDRPVVDLEAIYRLSVVEDAQRLLIERGEIIRHISMMLCRPRFIIMVDGDDESARQLTLSALARQLYQPGMVCSRLEILTTIQDSSAGDVDYLIWLQAGDVLHDRALYEFAAHINAEPNVDLIYADEDVLGPAGRHEPFFKPAWSPDTLEGYNYIGPGACFRASVARRHLSEAEGAYDFLLRFTERCSGISHIRQVLYHRTRGAADPVTPAQIHQARAALEGRLRRTGRSGSVSPIVPGLPCMDVRISLGRDPLVSIVIPTAGRTVLIDDQRIDLLMNCLDKIRERSSYRNLEFIIVDNGDLGDDRVEELARREIKRVTYRDPVFNIPKKLNMGAELADGDLLLLLNDDVEPLNADWIERLVEQFEKPHVGVVGAKLLYSDYSTQHVGVVTNYGCADHVRRLRPRDEKGYFFSTCGVKNYLAVTGACMMTPTSLYRQLGGYTEALAVSFNDVDYCLKAAEVNRYSVYTPHAELLHFESQSRIPKLDVLEQKYFMRRWASKTVFDPFYNEERLSVAPPTFEVRNNLRPIG